MIRRFLRRAGPWILVFTLVWYVAGSYLIGMLDDKSRELAESRHVHLQDLDIGSARELKFGRVSHLSEVKFIFDAKLSKLRIENHDLEITVAGAVANDRVVVDVGPTVPGIGGYNRITIHLPVSVNRISIRDDWSVELVGDASVPLSELTLVAENYSGRLHVSNFKSGRFDLEIGADTDPNKGAPSILIAGDATMSELNLDMDRGELEFKSETAPQQARFRVTDSVWISGQRPFVESIQFLPVE